MCTMNKNNLLMLLKTALELLEKHLLMRGVALEGLEALGSHPQIFILKLETVDCLLENFPALQKLATDG